MSIRISTNTWYDRGSANVGDLQSRISKLQDQLSSGKRIQTPSDDPIGAAQVLQLSQGQSMNEQYGVNRKTARNSLEMEEGVLQSITTTIQNAQALVVQAGNGMMQDEERKFIATSLSAYMDDLMGQANYRDSEGDYLFGGFRVTEAPYVKVPGGARYDGDQGSKMLQVGPLRQIETNDAGSAVFDNIKTGNGLVTSTAVASNTGSGIVSDASIIGAVNGDSYSVVFTSATEYNVLNSTTGETLSGPNTYVSGQSISAGGYQLSITGAPAAGDSFTAEPSKKQSLFTTMSDLIDLLNTPVINEADRARLANGLASATNNLGNALDNTLTVRAGVGSRLSELDSLDTQGGERDTLYAASMSALQDLDYTKAVSDLAKQQVILEAAQQSFAKIANLSLFNYMN